MKRVRERASERERIGITEKERAKKSDKITDIRLLTFVRILIIYPQL